LTGGERSDFVAALDLLEGYKPQAVLADRGYDSDTVVEAVKELGAIAVIPPKKNRRVQREYDTHLYKERNLIERLFNKLKHFRRIATRYDKLDVTFLGFLYLAGLYLWLK
jgi:transposase